MGDAIEAAGAGVRRVVGWEMVAVALVVLVRVVIKRISVGGSAWPSNCLSLITTPPERWHRKPNRERSYLRATPDGERSGREHALSPPYRCVMSQRQDERYGVTTK